MLINAISFIFYRRVWEPGSPREKKIEKKSVVVSEW